MKYARQTLVRDLLASLTAATGLEPGAVEEASFVGVDGRAQALDARVVCRLPGRDDPVELALVILSQVYPRDLRNVADRMAAYRLSRSAGQRDSVAPMVLSEHLSAGARKALRAEGIGFYDRSGSLHFRHGTWLCDIQRDTGKTAPPRPVRSLFHGAREQVVHALLMSWLRSHGEAWLTGLELAGLTQASTGTVSVTLQELERMELVEVKGKGPLQRRRVRDAAGLLDAWAQVWVLRARTEPRTRWYGYAPSLDGLAQRIAQGLAGQPGWALTGAAVANAAVPHLTHVDRLTVIVPPGAALEWAARLGLKEAEKGSNVTLVEREGASVQLTEQDASTGAALASPFIQYLDLLDGVGRHKELAAELRSQVLGLPPAPAAAG